MKYDGRNGMYFYFHNKSILHYGNQKKAETLITLPQGMQYQFKKTKE